MNIDTGLLEAYGFEKDHDGYTHNDSGRLISTYRWVITVNGYQIRVREIYGVQIWEDDVVLVHLDGVRTYDDVIKQVEFLKGQTNALIDENGTPFKVGDTLTSFDGYDVVVAQYDDGEVYGLLVCDESHPCHGIPYDINSGTGHVLKVESK